ncbi:hypothetical protein RU07_11010 [Agrobacterium tumefaciens]|uniref:Uncharacterized protein n=1 Tax=Agrobacterium tumefaciens TaxID=358 RepID=A0A0D0KXF0_AGRTU|nr:hypothetical protein RU07_11010 [Agrobacterium tumefaciens]
MADRCKTLLNKTYMEVLKNATDTGQSWLAFVGHAAILRGLWKKRAVMPQQVAQFLVNRLFARAEVPMPLHFGKPPPTRNGVEDVRSYRIVDASIVRG